MSKCLGYNELSKKLPKSIKKIFDKSRKEYHIMNDDNYYERILNEAGLCNKGFIVAINNGDLLVYRLDTKTFCGLSHETAKCESVIKNNTAYLYAEYFYTIISVDSFCDNDKIFRTIKHAIKLKFKVDVDVDYDDGYLEIKINSKSTKNIIQGLLIGEKFVFETNKLVRKICERQKKNIEK